jgi:hypothetical protein
MQHSAAVKNGGAVLAACPEFQQISTILKMSF